MLNEKQASIVLDKLERFEEHLGNLIFEQVDYIGDVLFKQTSETLYTLPGEPWGTICPGSAWGKEGAYGYFKTSYIVPKELAGEPLYLMPHTQGYESLLWVNGQPFGTYATKIVVTGHGNHYCDMICMNPVAGETIDLCVECYCGHFVHGDHPFVNTGRTNYTFQYDGMHICRKNRLISDFCFDLYTLTQLVRALDSKSYRRADVMKTLEAVHQIVYLDAEHISRSKFETALLKASPLLKEQLAKHNGDTVPYAGLIGHSHMDTAWLWHIDETVKKCARTYSNQLSLMAQYPEHHFMQSSAYHSQMMSEHYPDLFERIRKKVADGSYEPNGAVYVECDCNITGSEYLIRQFLWGQRFNRKHFNYTSDTFWLPDTFGYSASIPQIMQKSGVKYFMTVKLCWNDTNGFPYDSFVWAGLDGTKVLSHFPHTHTFPSPGTLAHFMYAKDQFGNVVKDKRASQMKLIAYGFGDGGGGPQFEQLEMARRLGNLEGMPHTEHTTVSSFMQRLEASAASLPTYNGELYLENHRGTLTNQHEIKRNNRKCEIALHDLELLSVMQAVAHEEIASGDAIHPLMQTLLVNQFHDILPGTGIPRVNEEARRSVSHAMEQAQKQIAAALISDSDSMNISVTNTLSFDRDDTLYLTVPVGHCVAGSMPQQWVTDVAGKESLAVSGIRIPAMGTVELTLVPGEPAAESPFVLDGNKLTTPYLAVQFDHQGFLASVIDRRTNRELRGDNGYPLNTFLIGEDVSWQWDSWNIDADLLPKLKPEAELLSRKVVSNGAVELRIECEYRLSEQSTLTQQMIFSAFSPEIRFDTIVHWQDDHRFLKVAFDTSIFTNVSREEIQFGHVCRSTNNNTSQEMAQFEVSCHKYADLSESRYGAAVLNDCKYGVYAKDGSIWLSLHKGGCNPDYTGDHGDHRMVYSLLPHDKGFGSETVIRPSYLLNYAPLQGHQHQESLPALLRIDADNVICEAVKPCEDAQRAYIVRLYEAEGTTCHALITFGHTVQRVTEANMLEENLQEIPCNDGIHLTFKPFEIKTLRVYY